MLHSKLLMYNFLHFHIFLQLAPKFNVSVTKMLQLLYGERRHDITDTNTFSKRLKNALFDHAYQ